MDLVGWAIFIAALLISVMLHETGHFVVAKSFGMKCTRYFVGFGPTIWSRFRGETEYGLKAIPLGGFVKIIGMHSLDDLDDPEDEPRSFRSKPAWQRILVLVAGSFMHLVIATVLMAGLVMAIGIENPDSTIVGSVVGCVPASAHAMDTGSCAGSHQKSPSSLAGLQAGDVVTSFNGIKVSSWTGLSKAIKRAEPGSRATLTVQRDGQRVTLHTTMAKIPGRNGSYLGVVAGTQFVTRSLPGALAYSGNLFGREISGSAQALAQLPSELPKLFSSSRGKAKGGQIISVIGMADATGQAVAANVGWRYKAVFVLSLIAEVNLLIGVFNMLPLLPLDGGHVFAIVLERARSWLARLRGRSDPGLIDMAKLLPAMLSIFMVVVVIEVLVLFADIVNPVHLGQ